VLGVRVGVLGRAPNILASAWEQHPEAGVAIAVTLVTQKDKDATKSSIKVYAKNTANSDLEFDFNGMEERICIYYMDSHGTQVPVRDFHMITIHSGRVMDVPITCKPGDILLRTVDITPAELILLQSHPVKCTFGISRSGKRSIIETTPRQLVAESTPPAQNEPLLSGSELTVSVAVAKADVIFTGQVIEIGHPAKKDLGTNVYHHLKLKRLEVLWGAIDAFVYVRLNANYNEPSESAPEVGLSYIFFAKKNEEGSFDPFTVLKLLPATDDNIAKVKQLIDLPRI